MAAEPAAHRCGPRRQACANRRYRGGGWSDRCRRDKPNELTPLSGLVSQDFYILLRTIGNPANRGLRTIDRHQRRARRIDIGIEIGRVWGREGVWKYG